MMRESTFYVSTNLRCFSSKSSSPFWVHILICDSVSCYIRLIKIRIEPKKSLLPFLFHFHAFHQILNKTFFGSGGLLPSLLWIVCSPDILCFLLSVYLFKIAFCRILNWQLSFLFLISLFPLMFMWHNFTCFCLNKHHWSGRNSIYRNPFIHSIIFQTHLLRACYIRDFLKDVSLS